MTDPTDALPDGPATTEQVFALMQPPHENIGFVSPVAMLEPGEIVGVQVEYGGEMGGAIYDGNKWVKSSRWRSDIDAAIHNDRLGNQIIEEIVDETREIISDEVQFPSTETFGNKTGEVYDPPPGWHTALCIRHRPLSGDDYHMLKGWPQIFDALAMWGNPDAGIVGVTTLEPRMGPEEATVIFVYYRPDLGTWRIYDTGRADSIFNDGMGDHIHKQVGRKLEEHYNELDMITGPLDTVQ